MELKDIQSAAETFQPEIEKHKHYDDVQNALLKKAGELELTWPETKQFSEAVHKLKFGAKPDLKPAATAAKAD